MSALLYMVTRRVKNNIVNLRREPSKLILVLVFVGLLFLSVMTPGKEEMPELLRSINELHAIILAVYTLFFALTAYNGFGSGSSMYSMADVMMLFPSPLKPRTILGYGLVRQLGLAALVCFFMIYQYSWINTLYGITPAGLAEIILCFVLVIFAGQLTAMLIYSQTSGDDRKKRVFKSVFFAVILLAVAAAGIYAYTSGGNLFDGTVELLSGKAAKFFPVSGWMSGTAAALMSGDVITALLWALPVIALLAVMVWRIGKTDTEYYEDVLAATEVAQSAITARKENGGMNVYVKKNVKVGKTGIGAGEGASAIYHKLKVESRRGRFFIVDTMSFIFIIITIVFVIIMKAGFASDPEMAADSAEAAQIAMISGLAMSVYMQMFSTAMGIFAKELTLPYIYMIPEPPFKKLLNCIRVSLPGFLAEGVLLWVPLMFIVGLRPADVIVCIVLRVLFGIFFVSTNIFADRFFGGLPKALLTAIYFILSIVTLIPAIAIGVVCLGVSESPLIALAAAGGTVLAVAALLLFVSRNMLECAELNRT